MQPLRAIAPVGEIVSDYDRRNLLIYAELIGADDAGTDWVDGASAILGRDPTADPEGTKRCWETHLVRARWIIGEGLGAAIEAFSESSITTEV
ncbi:MULTISPECIES: hypothetical protein [unclassified Sphingomonas]|uniref:hypothetical protein n=1 Tax=unclassified Sphingomonas TaxID=196159 RepID=UPI0006F37F84|nr:MULTISPECIES: hypothetical protein [unclassified Sphingomonas]KQX19148.1 hypothetical protein ASD17_11310 [Sphingomonas sp. Root1294]KQY65349.1 hypothetical protein ASD39_14505 [Sphingomonas sp. Root50]KRB95358.1 hypothetical protein ASE22_05550 [Sphingomonas sp. Root720]